MDHLTPLDKANATPVGRFFAHGTSVYEVTGEVANGHRYQLALTTYSSTERTAELLARMLNKECAT